MGEESVLNAQQLNNMAQSIKMYPVISSNIVAIGYDEKSRLLRVMFKGGANYLYSNVEPEMYNAIVSAESVGKSLTENVVRHKEKYKYIKL